MSLCSRIGIIQINWLILIKSMIFLIKIFILLFLFFLFLFFKVEFEVYPHLPSQSQLKLIEQPQGLPKQVVLIIVDSLRFDYAERFTTIKKFMDAYPNSTFLAKSKVGNPTMTTQRIESLMTGSEIFSSGNILKTFLASKVEVDNLISQLASHNKSSIIFGDNTWVKLFDFTNSQVCINTFDVHDLDSCDNVVKDNLPNQIFQKEISNHSSNFIVAHMLGIDHVGHSRSSTVDPMMDVKIKEISRFIQKLFNEADDQTMFLVTGDHGMREDGNHGGTSKVEVETLLFGYFKGGQLFGQNKKAVVAHSDITSTLSILLDIPLPNNAIGYPVLNLLPRSITSNEKIVSLNKNLYRHFSSMLQFYSVPLSTEEANKYQPKLDIGTRLQDQYILLQFLSQKLTFLKYSSPDPTVVMSISCMVSLLVVVIVVYAYLQDLVVSFTACRKRIFLMLFCQGLPMFTLFISYFSWTVIQNLSDALVAGFVVAAVFGVLLNLSNQKKLQTLLSIFISFALLSQIEPDKSNDYRPSMLRIQFLNQMVSNRLFWALLSSAQLIAYLKHCFSQFLTGEEHKSCRKQQLVGARIIISVLTYLSYFFTHIMQNQMHAISIAQTLMIVAFSFLLWLADLSSQQKQLRNNIRFLVISFLSVFMGPHFPLILAVCLYIERQTANCYNYSILMSLLSKCVWWWLGNRYEYSGVDILKTYVYSSSYAIVLNGVSLLIYLNSPFILNFVLLNCRLLSMRHQIEMKLFQGSANSNSYSWNISSAALEVQEQEQERPLRDQFVKYLQSSNMKYVGVLMLGLVSSIWTTLFNNQKILFTVVCVPVLVLITLITLTTLLLVIVVSFCYSKQRSEGYDPIDETGSSA